MHETMLLLIQYFCILHIVSCATDTDISTDMQDECNNKVLLEEITGLRQLVNQESLYRQELERQVRDFRQQLLQVTTPTECRDKAGYTGLIDDLNLSCLSNLSSMIQGIDSRITNIEGNFSQALQMFQEQERHLMQLKDMVMTAYLNVSDNFKGVLTSLKKEDNEQNNSTTSPVKMTNVSENKTETRKGTCQENKCGDNINATKGHTGRRFAIMVPTSMSNRKNVSIQLVISTEYPSIITLKSSYPGISRSYNISPPGLVITLPKDFALKNTLGFSMQSRGILLESTADISVYIYHEDAYVALPVRYLGTDYKIMTTDHGGCFFSVMPYGGNAVVDIKSSTGVSNRTVYIRELSVYYLWSRSRFRNVRISSNQTIAVLSGHLRSFTGAKQAVYDQLIPTNQWQKKFIEPYIQNTKYKFYFIYSTEKTKFNAIQDSNLSIQTVNAPYRIIIAHSFSSYYIEAINGSLSVVLWFYAGTTLNSFMCLVPSVAQYSNNYRFWVPTMSHNNYMAAIIKQGDRNGLMLDNSPVGNPLTTHSVFTMQRETYEVLTIALTQGWHVVKHMDPNVRFGLILYGGDKVVAYGLPLGLRLQ